MELRDIRDLYNVHPDEYVVLRMTGLYGDFLHSLSRLGPIEKTEGNRPWIIIHEYKDKDRIRPCLDLVDHFYRSGKLKYYFYRYAADSESMSTALKIILSRRQFVRLHDLYVFQPRNNQLLTPPKCGIEIPVNKDPHKAVIFRYSGWHKHYPLRNRPIEEWIHIERKLLDMGYNVTLLGQDDPMPNPNNLTDLRGKLTIKEVLDYTKDASICITVTTFLYVWTQFVCPTLVLTDSGDNHHLNRYWKLTPNMKTIVVNDKNYLSIISRQIEDIHFNRFKTYDQPKSYTFQFGRSGS